MATELSKAYDPKEAQQRCLAFWTEKNFGHSEPDGRTPYSIVIPPPNVTGALHMGHALNNTLQDVLIRWRRMQGFNAEWMPGTDHAGIATQAVVEKRIWAEEKKTRRDLGREELVRRIWQWKDQYEARILGQLKQIGCSCDWQRTAFTLDEKRSRAVRETFFRMFRDGYIFRGKRLVNWDTQLMTSVSDDETYTEDVKSGFWTFKYPVNREPTSRSEWVECLLSQVDNKEPLRELVHSIIIEHLDDVAQNRLAKIQTKTGASQDDIRASLEVVKRLNPNPGNRFPREPEFIRFSTTRPETMLGDTAVCVHPSDDRYKHLIGKTVTIPLVDREIPIIADGLLADPELGTGAVKVTPAHDPNDYACFLRHPEIGIINILNPDGTINENGGKYQGLERTKAREAVVKDMEAMGLFEGKEDRVIPMKFSDRSKTPIEPYLSDQWFVKMGDRDDGKPGFAQMAMDAVTSGRVKFFPARYANTYLEWLGEKRDWCISRQLWWGHRIPVWYAKITCNTPHQVVASFFQDGLIEPLSLGFDSEVAICRVVRSLDGETITDFEAEAERVDNLVRISENQDTADLALPEPVSYDVYICSLSDEWATKHIPPVFQRDPDVLDTWFSSMLWTHSTFGWPDQTPELAYYYPTSTLVTSRDIITLWVARMVIAGLYNLNDIPFHHVYITPKVLDGFGEGMSKSKGNGVDPLDIVEVYGADALRYQMVSIAGETQDSRLPVSNVCPHCGELNAVKQEHMSMRTKKVACIKCKKPFRPGGPWPDEDPELPTAKQASERFELGRNFANKLWNAARFVLKELDGYTAGPLDPKDLPIEDRWILSRLATTTRTVTDLLEGYHFSEVARTVYEFTWSEFCDWYIEMAKGRLRNDERGVMSDESNPNSSLITPHSSLLVRRVLVGVLDAIVKLIHPIMPFVAESLWQALNESAPDRGVPEPLRAAASVMIAPWPVLPTGWQDPAMETRIARMQELVRIVRDVRNRYGVDSKTQLEVFVRCSEEVATDFQALRSFVSLLAGVSKLHYGPGVAKPKQAASQVTPEFEAYVSLAGLIDPAAEVKRLEKQLGEKRGQLDNAQRKLANEGFLTRAKPEVVTEQRELVADLEKQIASMDETIRELKA